MSISHFSATELTELEALEIMGGATAGILASQEKCTNKFPGCALGDISQIQCINDASYCSCQIHFTGNECSCNTGALSPQNCFAKP